MAGVCPAPSPEDPLVRGLLNLVDCHVRTLAHSGYSAMFQPSSSFSFLLTALLTIYVAIIGYRLLLGQSQLRVSDFVLGAVKIGAVLALATQWDTYQAVVYRVLFDGPQQLANAMLVGVQPDQAQFGGSVFDGLQRAFDDLSGFANSYAAHSATATSPLIGGAGFGALLLTTSASILLISSLGVLLAAKIVLGLLLAVGPLFIALFLFDSTRGLFEGWLRASIAFAFAPFATTLLLGVALAMLEPSLLQMEAAVKQPSLQLEPVYSVTTLILVFAGVSLGALIAGGMIAAGVRLPKPPRQWAPTDAATLPELQGAATVLQTRAMSIAAAASRLERSDSLVMASRESNRSDRRSTVMQNADRGGTGTGTVIAGLTSEPRLGQGTRRRVAPRSSRPTARSA